MKNARFARIAPAILALTLAACATSQSKSADDPAASPPKDSAAADTTAADTTGPDASAPDATSEASDTTVAASGSAGDVFADLGEITLSVWADAGEEATLAVAEEQFESAHPNVDVVTTVRGFDDYITVIVNTMQSDDAPDVAQGNQGYGVDGLLVKAGLIAPLDEYAATYGWDQRFSEGALKEFRWAADGEFGSGELYGVSPIAEFVGVYVNTTMLAELQQTVPTTLDEFESVARAALAAGERPIQLGNSEGWPGTHVFGLLQAAFTPPAETRDWITGADGATFASDTNAMAAARLQQWASDGFFGDDYNGVANDDAVARFEDGDGLFFMGGTWNTGTFAESLGDEVGFFAMPPGPAGSTGATGSLGLGWHISSVSEHPDVAAAFIALLHSEEFTGELAELGRIPAQAFDGSAEGVFADSVAANAAIVESDGYTFFPDWSTDTMYDTYTAVTQELMAGRVTPADFTKRIQDDWEAFQAGR